MAIIDMTSFWEKDIEKVPETQSETFLQEVIKCEEMFGIYSIFSFWILPRRHVVECRIQDFQDRSFQCQIEYDIHTRLYNAKQCSIPVDIEPNTDLDKLVSNFGDHHRNLSFYFDMIDMVESTFRYDQIPNPKQKYKYNTRSLILGSGFRFEVSFNLSGECDNMRIVCHDGDIQFKLEEKLNNWDNQMSFSDNVYNIFGNNTLTPGPVEKEATCRICFGNWDDDDNCKMLNKRTATVQCLFSNCSAVFHWECIRDWLLDCNSCIQFGMILGNCPDCKASLSVSQDQ